MKRGKKKIDRSETSAAHSGFSSLRRYARPFLVSLIVGLTILSFSPAFRSGFLWDDDAVTDNPLLKSPGGLYQIWFSPSVMTKEAHYWPLVYTAFWVQYQLFGARPLGYHIVNLIFHIINVLLLWKIFSEIDKRSAYFAALLFAVHPVHVEAVAWIIELKDVLSVAFYLTSFLLFMKFYEEKRLLFYFFSLTAFAAALLTKSMTVTLPAALVLWLVARGKKLSLRDVRFLSAFAVIAIFIAWSDARFSQGREIIAFDFSLIERVRIASRAIIFYIEKLFFPINLVTFYPRFRFDAHSILSYLPLMALIILLIFLFLLRRYSRAPLLLFLFYVITLSPVLGFVNFYFMTFSFVADRYQYLASAGLLFLFSIRTRRFFQLITKDKPHAFLVFQILVTGILAVLTFYQTTLYRDNETLFKHNVRINPEAWAAHNNLGVEYQQGGKFAEAVRHYEKAVELNPRFMDAHNNLGILLAQGGNHDEALRHFQTALSIKPHDSRTLGNMGIVYSIKKDYENAASYLKKALEEDPASSSAAFNLALVYIHKGEPDMARYYLRKTLEIDPLRADARARLDAVDSAPGDALKIEDDIKTE